MTCWRINVGHGDTLRLEAGAICLRLENGPLVRYRPKIVGAVEVGPLRTVGRTLTVRP